MLVAGCEQDAAQLPRQVRPIVEEGHEQAHVPLVHEMAVAAPRVLAVDHQRRTVRHGTPGECLGDRPRGRPPILRHDAAILHLR
jgi:hypothetical protein